jgi:predicted Zn-dependent protease
MAECLARGDRPAAAIHLEAYVKQYPDQLLFRLQLAELLVQIGKDATARWHYEKFVARAQGERGNIGKYLVHAHTRLMEIAQRADDRYSELFHRGVGLILLVREQDGEPDRDDALLEELLCKSLRALTEASELKPGSLRVRAYLAEAYERTGNRRAADREREACRNSPTGNELTGFERKQVQLLMDREKN